MDERDRDEQNKQALRLDEELSSAGLVGREMFLRFVGAHIYGTATPMQWLEGRLRVLKARLQAGDAVSLYDPESEEVSPCNSVAELFAWAGRHLPDARV